MITLYSTMKATMNQLLRKHDDVRKRASQVLTSKSERKVISYKHEMLRPFILCNALWIEMNIIQYVNANRLKKFGSCLIHEGTNQVKESKINLLVHNYELFFMKDNETIVEVITRFTDIVNGLEALGKTYKGICYYYLYRIS